MPDPIPPIPMQIPPGYGLFTIKFKSIYGPKVFTCNFGFKWLFDDAINPANNILALFTATGCPAAPASYTDRFQLLGATVLYREDVELLTYEKNVVVPGTGAWESPPINTSLLVQKLTGVAGRRNKGRAYWPSMGVAEADVDTLGQITSTRVGLLQTQWDTLMTGFTGSDFTPYMLHGGTKANPTVAPLPTRIIRFLMEPLVATQRRRMR